MLMGLVAAIAVAVAVLIRPRSLPRLATIPLRAWWLLPAALGAQVLVVDVVPSLPHVLGSVIHLLSYALVAWFLAVNLRLPGMPLVVAGTAANAVTIALNGGVLPASPAALQAAGWSPGTTEFANSAVVASPRLAFLGDVFVTPPWVPFANVFSVGDVLISAGLVVLVLGVTARRPRHRELPRWGRRVALLRPTS
jgi:hypothetical protein